MNNNNNKLDSIPPITPYISVSFTECTFTDGKFNITLSVSEELEDEDSALSFAETLSKDIVGIPLDVWDVNYKNIGNYYSYNEVNKKYKISIQY
jgi:hypothetical protein